MITKLFPPNEHKIDRILRVILGVGLLSLAFVGPQTPLGYIGLVPLITGLAGRCPVYRLLNLSTLRKADQAD